MEFFNYQRKSIEVDWPSLVPNDELSGRLCGTAVSRPAAAYGTNDFRRAMKSNFLSSFLKGKTAYAV